MKSLLVASLAVAGAYAQSGAWGQCGGNNWSGATTCVAGYTCTYQNDWYSQCLPGANPVTTTTAKATSTTTTRVSSTLTTSTRAATTTATNPGTSKKFKWFGVNQSVGEFGSGAYPGVWGKDFYFPDPATITVRPYPVSRSFSSFELGLC